MFKFATELYRVQQYAGRINLLSPFHQFGKPLLCQTNKCACTLCSKERTIFTSDSCIRSTLEMFAGRTVPIPVLVYGYFLPSKYDYICCIMLFHKISRNRDWLSPTKMLPQTRPAATVCRGYPSSRLLTLCPQGPLQCTTFSCETGFC